MHKTVKNLIKGRINGKRETGSETGKRETVETAIDSRFEKRGVRCRRFVRGVGFLRCFKHNVISCNAASSIMDPR